LFQFTSFKSRLLVFIIGLLGIVLGAVFVAVNRANVENARLHLEEALEITASSFAKDLQDRERILTEKVRLLSGDFAFKTAFATQERETIRSALENHRMRANASVMMLVSLDGRVIASTLEPGPDQDDSSLKPVLELAMQDDHGEASAIQLIGGQAYQLVVVPLFTPQPSAWILIGFVINDAFVRIQREHTRSEVSLMYRPADTAWQDIGSTLSAESRQELMNSLTASMPAPGEVTDVRLQQEDFLSLLFDFQSGGTGTGIAILQRSLDAALAPYLRLRTLMLLLFGVGLLLSIGGAVLIARGLSRPVELLVQSTRRIESGDYSTGVSIRRKDEIGTLAHSFNTMVSGLAERDKVQNLLGKVVSREIADELLSREIELGGEEREVTVLFSDIRSFTTLCESRSPQEILTLLNRFLTHMSKAVESEGGVVDKYIGDAIMALFGAPIRHQDSPERAVRCSISMQEALVGLNRELREEDQGGLKIGVGINTAVVVAGNVGSTSRLNYTVLGDGVNLASRLEGLTKNYGVGIIVSESTKNRCPAMVFRELDLVRVKGKHEPVAIFEPLHAGSALCYSGSGMLDRYHSALELYRRQEWAEAARLFGKLAADAPEEKLYQLYQCRIDNFQEDPPPEDWGGVTVFTQK